ncbi:tRNA uridine-5-carboxymethylaminomethyl(34) synthesis GTPase MnmE [Chelativorans sp. Marseille-P2723]|uniref:tRNA uridine-5-carboxymethylaminomethyl(34) synthesis GTPase MnmE n=1 Tax=Chelativorans sp. Marseille-P2723 TaxID=2709133 RepID=UPI00156F998B|nr:tRNA uridine-5-carboxymethylaminomethyl(34) synthesis GTPase MnmE [Chelativorans sp. Marseille-P2723]
MLVRDTIFALSSGGLPSGVAIVRMSGPDTRLILESLAGHIPPPRKAVLTDFRDQGGILLDRGLCLFFPGPASFTGEDCGELHLHGGRAVVAAMLRTLASFPSLRAADPGEFTKRAFLNGKIDLTGAEALSDLISSETEAQRRFALANSTERHQQLYESWRQRLIRARAMIEAELDFADEADIPDSVGETIWEDVRELRAEITGHAKEYHYSEIIREGFQVVILGAPNAGKSSLLNALARRDVAIVTDVPGTTRDILEVSLDLGGVKVVLSDTAGIRDATEQVEAMGIERSLRKAAEADLILLLEDAANPIAFDGLPAKPTLKIGSKADLILKKEDASYDLLVSAETGEGLDSLTQRLKETCKKALEGSSDTLPFRARHVVLLNEAIAALEKALLRDQTALELRAEDLRVASHALGRIHGAIDVEDLLDAIFSTFCIGK